MTTPQPAIELPKAGQIFLDHVGWMVPDMDAASATFAQLGFPLTPYSVHGTRAPKGRKTTPTGSANRLALLQKGYLEILTPHGDVETDVSRHLKAAIARHIGVHLVAFSVSDAEGEGRRLEREGFSVSAPVHLRRTVEGEDGAPVELAFTVVRAAFDTFPQARVQFVTHHTPEHLLQPRYLPKENALVALTEAAFVSDQPPLAAARFAQFLGRPVRAGAREAVIALDRGVLRFLDPRAALQAFGANPSKPLPSVAAVTLTSSDLGRTRDCFLSNGLRPGSLGQPHLLIDAAEAMGVHLVVLPDRPEAARML